MSLEQNYHHIITRMDSQIASVRSFIQANWNNTVRQPSLQSPTEICLPYPFTVPTAGSMFQLFQYWDTYFSCEGLLRDGLIDLATNDINNILYLINTFGFMPNYALQGNIFRSQPPVASLIVEKIYQRTHNKPWLTEAYAVLEKEYSFWMTFRSGPHKLNHYGWLGYPKDIEKFYWVIKDRLTDIPLDPTEKMHFQAHALAEIESGWDFTPRFDRRCADFYAIDLNSLLFIHETNAAFFSDQLGNQSSATWRKRALQRRVLINRLCWDDQSGFYYDYDMVNNQRSGRETAAAFFTLWAGIPSIEQASQMVMKLPQLEYEYGLVACRPDTTEQGKADGSQIYQWTFPNAWPPLQFAAIAGLSRYGFLDEAKRLAGKYVMCVTQNFIKTGNLWEKYNAITGSVDVPGDDPMPPMLGWTAGTYLYALEVLET